MDEWVMVNLQTLSKDLGLTYRQTHYNITKYLEFDSDGSGSFMSLKQSQLKVLRKAAPLIQAGITSKKAFAYASQMIESGLNQVKLPGGLLISIES